MTLTATKKYQLFIGGKWVDAASGREFASYNPSTGEINAYVAEAQAEDVDLAVKAARKAFESGPWAEMSPTERGRLLYRAAQLMWERKDFLAEVESRDNGEPINETKLVLVPLAIEILEFYAGLANKIQGETLSTPESRFIYTLKQPVGVVGAIVPWNVPLMLAIWKIAPALAAGNTMVIKPAEDTPISILELMKIFQEAGLPDGVINVVPGYGETAGAELASHPGIDKLAFTGSTSTGRLIMQAAGKNLVPVSLELGGKSPNIVFEDAVLEDAVNGTLFGIYLNQGEVCAAGSRLFVQDSIYDKFMDLFVKKAKSIRVGNALDPSTQMGPLVSEKQLNTVANYVRIGCEEGARLTLGGQRIAEMGQGNYFMPTVFEEVRNDMTIAREEIFGPVVSVIRFKDEEDVLRMANDTMYGLASGIWTTDIKRVHRMARGLQAGTVYVNTYNMLDAAAPFGGFKKSGFGRELGIEALDLYTQTKCVWIDLNAQGLNWYGN